MDGAWGDLITAGSGAAGVAVGALVTAYRAGAWRQKIEDGQEVQNKRLDNGKEDLREIPAMSTKIDGLCESVKEIRQKMDSLVTHGECDRRHEVKDA